MEGVSSNIGGNGKFRCNMPPDSFPLSHFGKRVNLPLLLLCESKHACSRNSGKKHDCLTDFDENFK